MASAPSWHKSLRYLLGALLTLALPGCGQDPAQVGPGVWTIVDIEGALRERVDRVELQSDRRSTTVWLRNAPVGSSLHSLPLLLDLAWDETRVRDVLRVRGFQGDTELVQRFAELGFARDQRSLLKVTLSDVCARRVSECSGESGSTCVNCRGVCESAKVAASDLQTIATDANPLAGYTTEQCGGSDAGALADAGSTGNDASLDSAVRDAGPVPPTDAGALPVDAGVLPVDAGVLPVDTGVAPADASQRDAQTVTPDPLRADCALLLHMNEQSWTGAAGEVRDDSGRDNHGRASGTAATDPAGKFARSGKFDGQGWVSVPDSASLRPTNALTVAVWLYLDELPGTRYPGLVTKRAAFQVDTTFSLFLTPENKVAVDVDGEESRFFSAGTVGTGRWQHIAFVFDGSQPAQQRVKLYIDGVLDTTAPETSTTIPPFAADLVIGNLVNGGETYVGRLDEVGLWTRALRPDEVIALAHATASL